MIFSLQSPSEDKYHLHPDMGVKSSTWYEAGERLVAGLTKALNEDLGIADQKVLDKGEPPRVGNRLSPDIDRSLAELAGNKNPYDKETGEFDPYQVAVEQLKQAASEAEYKEFHDDINKHPTEKQDLEKVDEYPPDVDAK